MKEVKGRLTALVTFCVKTAFYNRLVEGKIKGGKEVTKTRKKR